MEADDLERNDRESSFARRRDHEPERDDLTEASPSRRRHKRPKHPKRYHEDDSVSGPLEESSAVEQDYNPENTPVRKTKRPHHRRDKQPTPISEALEGLGDDVVEGDLPVAEGTDVLQSSYSGPPDKVYIQDKNGFRPSTRDRIFQGDPECPPCDSAVLSYPNDVPSPIEFSLLLQHGFKLICNFCQGLLAGIALLHFVLIMTMYDSHQAIVNFAEGSFLLCRFVQIFYFFLTTVAFVGSLDRGDFAHLDLLHFGDMVRYRLADFLLVIMYFCLLVITVICTKWDDRLALTPYNFGLWNDRGEAINEFQTWQRLSAIRAVLAVTAYVTVFLGPGDDLFYLHLCNMVKYEEQNRRPVLLTTLPPHPLPPPEQVEPSHRSGSSSRTTS